MLNVSCDNRKTKTVQFEGLGSETRVGLMNSERGPYKKEYASEKAWKRRCGTQYRNTESLPHFHHQHPHKRICNKEDEDRDGTRAVVRDTLNLPLQFSKCRGKDLLE